MLFASLSPPQSPHSLPWDLKKISAMRKAQILSPST